MQESKKASTERRYEIDILRGIIALIVVLIHSIGSTQYLDSHFYESFIRNLIISLIQFNRNVFIFITAFILVYIYNAKGLNIKNFWSKRTVGILIPYALWSILYALFYGRGPTFIADIYTIIIDIVSGSAYYQLYYILLAVEFYMIFPYFLQIVQRLKDRYMKVIIWVFVGQVIFNMIDYYGIQLYLLGHKSTILHFIYKYQDRFILDYLAYIVLGGLIALNIDKFEQFLQKYIKQIFLFLITIALLIGVSYTIETVILHLPIYFTSNPMQPLIVPYSIAVTFVMYYIIGSLVKKWKAKKEYKWLNFWVFISECSFGIYLIHPLVLNAIKTDGLPMIPFIPVWIQMILLWVLTSAITTGIVYLFMRIPYLKFTVGKPLDHKVQKNFLKSN